MKLNIEEMEQICKKCAEKMKYQNLESIEVDNGHIDRALANGYILVHEAKKLRTAIKGSTRRAIIEKSGNEWCVFSEKKDKEGHRKKLGCYPTKEGAEKRLKQVEYFKHKGKKVEGMALPIEGDNFGISIGTQFFLKSAIKSSKYQELLDWASMNPYVSIRKGRDGIYVQHIVLTSDDFNDSNDYYRLSSYLSGIIGGSELGYRIEKEAIQGMKVKGFRGKSIFGIKNIEGVLCPECSKDFLAEGTCNKCGYRKAQTKEVMNPTAALTSANAEERYEAVDRIGRQGNVELLTPLLKDEDNEVRHWATRWIGQKGDIELVEAMLNDPDEDIRIEAIDWVSRRGNKELLKVIAATDASGLVRDRAKLRLKGRKAQAEDEIEDVPIEKGKEQRFIEEQEALTPAGPPEVVKTTLPKKYKKPAEEVIDLSQSKTLLDLFSTAEKIQSEITNVEELIDNMVAKMTEEKGLEESKEKLEGVWKEIRKLVGEQPGRVAKFKDRVYAIMAQRMRVPQPKYKEIAEQLVAEFDDITGRMNARYNVLRSTAKSLKNVYKFFTAPVELYKKGQIAVAEPAIAEEPVRALEPATTFGQLDEAVGYSYDILDAISGFSDDLTILGFAISAAEDDLEVLPEAVDLPEVAMKEV